MGIAIGPEPTISPEQGDEINASVVQATTALNGLKSVLEAQADNVNDLTELIQTQVTAAEKNAKTATKIAYASVGIAVLSFLGTLFLGLTDAFGDAQWSTEQKSSAEGQSQLLQEQSQLLQEQNQLLQEQNQLSQDLIKQLEKQVEDAVVLDNPSK